MRYIFICLLALILYACASGSAIVTGMTRPPIDPSQVKLYLEAPTNYEVIGIVKASSDSGWSEQGSQDYAIDEIKKQAAKLGANGVILATTGEKTTTAIGGYSSGVFFAGSSTAQTISGKAIYVSE